MFGRDIHRRRYLKLSEHPTIRGIRYCPGTPNVFMKMFSRVKLDLDLFDCDGRGGYRFFLSGEGAQ